MQTEEENDQLFQNIKTEILNALMRLNYNGHLEDIGDLIGVAIGRHIANKNILAFTKDDFLDGFDHGYSIEMVRMVK